MTAAPHHQQLVAFRLGNDQFAADVFSVERVLRYVPPRAIPNVPAWIAGVVDYQQRVVPVIDLRARFELPPVPPKPETRILVLHVDGEWIGAIVDAVTEVASVEAGAVQPPPPLFRGLSAAFLKGVVRRGDALIVVLDTARLLSTTERLVLEQAGSAPSRETDLPTAGAPADA
ncbi:MAG: chemotaxis protein CheW [Gemmatimonadaceae bacterium]|nr:chemotaxis protein CheW [Gemmatimonadaceae bacterium]